jgi:acetyl-CoA synthetase
MSEPQLYPSPITAASGALIPDLNAWREAWMSARDDHSAYWLQQTQRLIDWHSAPSQGCEGDFWSVQERAISWFSDGSLNVSYQCLDRHLAERGDQVAIIWEADEPGEGE